MGFFDSLFGGGKKNNPAEAAMPYFNQIPGQTSQYLQPYVNAGQQALSGYAPYVNAGQQAIPQLQNEYAGLLNNPGGKLNQIGTQFHESPGFKFALEQALNGQGRHQAASGMYGSPEHEQHNMELATHLADQEYYNWLNQAQGLYGHGLEGEQNFYSGGQNALNSLASGGLQAGNSLADMIAQTLSQQGQLAFRGKQEENSQRNSLLSGLGRGALTLAAFTPWGQAAGLSGGNQ
jgi:hypothetical protein